MLAGVPAVQAQAADPSTPAAALAEGDRAEAQEQTAALAAANIGRFLAGAAAGLVVHESGHLATDYLFGAHPGFRRVHFGPIPFFAITHRELSPRREFVVASAGFWAQQLGSEILLTRRPCLRAERAPVLKGMLAFNVLSSVAYAGAAFWRAGPPERDTRAMAAFGNVDERAVGAMILAPALLDAVRYYRPRSAWAAWASRAAKVGMVVLVARRTR